MIGAGVFAAVGPAAEAAGSGLLVGLAIAALVAYANATASAQLAAVHPEAGGTYIYGRRRLGPFWGYLAGWGFVVGKTASLSAMALTVGAYAFPEMERPVALVAVAAMSAVNYMGVQKTARLSRVVVTLVLITLGLVVVASLRSPGASAANLAGPWDAGALGILRSAGLLFFAFAGYARLATLGEEVIGPKLTIPKAITVSLGATLVVYTLVMVSALVAVGPADLASATAPLARAAGGGMAWAIPVIRVGGALAALGVLLSLLAGVSRTGFAMARNGELPRWLAAVHPDHGTPHRAEAAVALVVMGVVAVADLRGVIGFSSFAILTYYAIANASAFTQPVGERRWPRWLQVVGVGGCGLLAFTLPLASVCTGLLVLGVGSVVWLVRHRT